MRAEANASQLLEARRQKAAERRKYKRLGRLRQKQLELARNGSALAPQTRAPELAAQYWGKVRENERLVELEPKLRVLNQVEVCDMELLQFERKQDQLDRAAELQDGGKEFFREAPFVVSWIDRVNGEASLEATNEQLMNCERRQNYTFKLRAIGCNGLHSKE